MPNPIPPTLAAYLQQCIDSSSPTLITSILNAPSTWLTLRFVYAILHGTDDATPTQPASNGAQVVVFVSFFRPLSVWVELGKKMALDIPSLVRTGRIVYVDGLNLASAAISTTDAQRLPTTKVKSHRLNDIRGAINLALASQSLTTPPSPPSSVNMSEKGAKPVVIIDGVDFVLASQPEVDRLNLQQFLFHVRLRAHALILSCNADAPLLHHHDDSATPLEREHSAFLTTMAHQSSYVMQLRDLETGTAKDITGVLRISSGGSDLYEGPQGPAEKLHNGEWLYQVRGDGQVRVWTRGE